MGKKSSNEVRMIGVIPSQGADPIPVGKIPDDGTQIAKGNDAEDETKIIHTVTAGKTFYLSLIVFSHSNNAVSSQRGRMFVVDDGNNLQYYIVNTRCLTGDGKGFSIPFLPPLELVSEYAIKVVSDTADSIIWGFIHGYEM